MDDADQRLSSALLDVVSALKAWQNGLVPCDDVSALTAALTQLCHAIDETTHRVIMHMVSRHYNVLTQLERMVLASSELRSHQDGLFDRLKRIAGWRVVASATRAFEAFIKGITYFSHEREPKQRAMQHWCGYRSNGNHICLERLFIESLIYERIFRHEVVMKHGFPSDLSVSGSDGEEEEGNAKGIPDGLFNFSRTKQDFEACCPDTRIHVEVTYHAGMPHRVIVQRSTPAEEGTTTFVYEKDCCHADWTYSEVVTCTKFSPDRSVWMKASTFDTPGTFRRIG